MTQFDYFSDAVGSYAENQRITAVRKVFQRGVVNPMINIEALWKDYGAYENVSYCIFKLVSIYIITYIITCITDVINT
jgi:hypothetical protein